MKIHLISATRTGWATPLAHYFEQRETAEIGGWRYAREVLHFPRPLGEPPVEIGTRCWRLVPGQRDVPDGVPRVVCPCGNGSFTVLHDGYEASCHCVSCGSTVHL